MSEPITRTEMYLAALSGEAVTIPTPITRLDHYLYTLCQRGSDGGGGATDAQVAAAVAAYMAENPVEGGGISVTGATAGQIVQISEVDENGVPTAWLPVDMPSGGDTEWRHIRTVTIPEDPSTDTSGVSFLERTGNADATGYIFAFDTDENGEPFALSELFIRYNAGTSSASAVLAFGFHATNTPYTPNHANSIDLMGSFAKAGSTTAGWCVLSYYGGGCATWGAWNTGVGTENVKSKKDTAASGKAKGFITALFLHQTSNYSSFGFTPGSVFEIYGR